MLVRKIGEFGLINRIKKIIRTDSSVIKGIGDDCAVLKYDKNHYQLLTCDMLVEGVDFTRKDKPFLVGRKALAISISDIASCGGEPRYALVSLGIPKSTPVDLVDKIYWGMISLAKLYKTNIVGGDISSARSLTINVSLLGEVEKNNLLLRSTALPGDFIFVTGDLGGSISGKHLKFTPRLKEARFLVKNFKINSMIDVSDGLASDLGHILKESRVGAFIYEKLIPVSKQARSLADALYMGEDFELLFTMPRKQAGKLMHMKKRINCRLIGEIVDKNEGLRLVDGKGRIRLLKLRGFRHF
jgi:thiamine-monophosphate kinase